MYDSPKPIRPYWPTRRASASGWCTTMVGSVGSAAPTTEPSGYCKPQRQARDGAAQQPVGDAAAAAMLNGPRGTRATAGQRSDPLP